LPERRGRSRDHFAKDFGVSGQTVSDAQTVRKIGADKWQRGRPDELGHRRGRNSATRARDRLKAKMLILGMSATTALHREWLRSARGKIEARTASARGQFTDCPEASLR